MEIVTINETVTKPPKTETIFKIDVEFTWSVRLRYAIAWILVKLAGWIVNSEIKTYWKGNHNG